ncbi:hypothetical protein [Companilactobacillus muriivasis]|uniref:hypothetical protein n=1 Tax=Companilactobacillus muriivasis TaxID=3081444 RepID=UPI0030C6B64E
MKVKSEFGLIILILSMQYLLFPNESSSRNNPAGGSQKWGVRREGGVIALAITPRTIFETRFSAQKRGERPWLEPVLTADCPIFWLPEAAYIKTLQE